MWRCISFFSLSFFFLCVRVHACALSEVPFDKDFFTIPPLCLLARSLVAPPPPPLSLSSFAFFSGLHAVAPPMFSSMMPTCTNNPPLPFSPSFLSSNGGVGNGKEEGDGLCGDPTTPCKPQGLLSFFFCSPPLSALDAASAPRPFGLSVQFSAVCPVSPLPSLSFVSCVLSRPPQSLFSSLLGYHK